jgi:hypothetical protein
MIDQIVPILHFSFGAHTFYYTHEVLSYLSHLVEEHKAHSLPVYHTRTSSTSRSQAQVIRRASSTQTDSQSYSRPNIISFLFDKLSSFQQHVESLALPVCGITVSFYAIDDSFDISVPVQWTANDLWDKLACYIPLSARAVQPTDQEPITPSKCYYFRLDDSIADNICHSSAPLREHLNLRQSFKRYIALNHEGAKVKRVIIKMPRTNSRDLYHIPVYWDVDDVLTALLSFHPYVSFTVKSTGHRVLPRHHMIQPEDLLLFFETGC